MLIQKNDLVLFYGDSITDCGRAAQSPFNNGMGFGYAAITAGLLTERYPRMGLKFINRGISGNRVYDLETRLRSDVLDLRPTLVSILIGINDTWRRYDSNVASPIADFIASYRRICESILDMGSRLLICEPFLLPVPPERGSWREDLDGRINAIRELAAQVKAPYVPLDGVFAAAATASPAADWLPDGVHPSVAGHCLIAETIIDVLTR